eukprot:9489379-Karenia_brevis.AAC.1
MQLSTIMRYGHRFVQSLARRQWTFPLLIFRARLLHFRDAGEAWACQVPLEFQKLLTGPLGSIAYQSLR